MAEQNSDTPEAEPLTRLQVLIAMGVTAVVLLFIAKAWIYFGSVTLIPVKFSFEAVLQGIALGLAITVASSITYRIWGAYRRSADYYLELILKPLLFPDLIWLGLLPGLSEELIFRGVMLPEFGLNLEGILISSLCFGVLHMNGLKQWAYIVWATIIGIALGYSAVWTGNLLVPIVAHVCTNFVAGCVWKFSD
ncbi:MAG: CPBP family intramembrane metalloprotease [Myxacorys chilensis ATA2-1-KO14]|nr:CPBP family intramembrane metalloprotease [Myxacorys chilensis ATA2-1-KO14]